MPANMTDIKEVLANADLIYNSDQIASALDKIAAQLNERFKDQHPLVLCVMRGGIVFTGHLLTRLTFCPELDYVHATRYRNQTAGNELEWYAYAKTSLKNRTILILDDILDEGITLDAIVKNCYAQGAKEVVTVVLVHKKHNRNLTEFICDYIGLEVEDRYVFGFGMDYEGELRHLNSIYAAKGA